jgi:hypothetical protein
VLRAFARCLVGADETSLFPTGRGATIPIHSVTIVAPLVVRENQAVTASCLAHLGRRVGLTHPSIAPGSILSSNVKQSSVDFFNIFTECCNLVGVFTASGHFAKIRDDLGLLRAGEASFAFARRRAAITVDDIAVVAIFVWALGAITACGSTRHGVKNTIFAL